MTTALKCQIAVSSSTRSWIILISLPARRRRQLFEVLPGFRQHSLGIMKVTLVEWVVLMSFTDTEEEVKVEKFRVMLKFHSIGGVFFSKVEALVTMQLDSVRPPWDVATTSN